MNNVIIGLISASISAAVTYILTKRVYERKMDKLAEKTTKELLMKEEQLSEMHRVFVKSQPMPESLKRQKIWDTIIEKTKSNTYIPKTDEEVVKEFRDGIMAARTTTEERYSEAMGAIKTYGGDESPSDISVFKEISFEVYDSDEEGYDKEDLSYYMSCGDLYDDRDYLLDDPKGVIGLNSKELEDRVDTAINFDGANMFYIRDDDTRTDYCITIFGPETMSPYEASLDPSDDE